MLLPRTWISLQYVCGEYACDIYLGCDEVYTNHHEHCEWEEEEDPEHVYTVRYCLVIHRGDLINNEVETWQKGQYSKTVKANTFHCPYMLWCWSSWQYRDEYIRQHIYINMFHSKMICCFTIYASYYQIAHWYKTWMYDTFL